MVVDEPIARRRTPRKSAAPSRLGVDDNWAFSPAGKWTTDEGKKAKEEAKAEVKSTPKKSPMKERPPPPPAVVESAKTGASLGGYLALRDSYPRTANVAEGALLTMLGDGIAQIGIQGKELNPERMLIFALWGAIISIIIGPYLGWLNTISLSKTSKKLDAALKAVMNAFLSTPFITALFMIYWTTYTAAGLASVATYTDAIKGSFGQLYMAMATYWIAADLVNLSLVPPKFQLLCASVSGCLGSVIQSFMTM